MVKVYIEEFLKIKTGVLFNDILNLIDDLSVAFQIWDDLMNLRPSTVSKNKNKIGEDITEGKLTIMVLHSLHKNNNYKKRLMDILMKNTKDQNEINEAIDIMHKNGSIAYSERVKDLYLEKFEKKCKDIMFNEYNKYERKDLNYKVLNALIELKTSLIKV
jgi:geranylgeranyl pyrophosphate synthase